MKTYRAVLFDLFGTVALFDPEKLPLFEWNGHISRSTLGALRTIYEQKVPTVPFVHFYTALSAVSRELGEVRAQEMREVSSAHRFTLTLTRIGFRDSSSTRQLAEELSLAHMALLSNATAIPAAHRALLTRVRERYAAALVSNFDHGPTARLILRREGAVEHFHHITISDEHGWRKPHPKIFTDALAVLGVEPEDALFVGDSPHDDIRGARGAGLDSAWVNAPGDKLPAGIPDPTYVVRALPELESVLFS